MVKMTCVSCSRDDINFNLKNGVLHVRIYIIEMYIIVFFFFNFLLFVCIFTPKNVLEMECFQSRELNILDSSYNSALLLKKSDLFQSLF